jgi:hypothetical protein
MKNVVKLCELHTCQKIYKERVVKSILRKEWICELCEIDKRATYRKNNRESILNLEKQFEPWMNWQNHGVYKNWDDNDQSTWTWQIDHIIPQSDLPYTSMEDENFKKCWAL